MVVACFCGASFTTDDDLFCCPGCGIALEEVPMHILPHVVEAMRADLAALLDAHSDDRSRARE